MQKFLYQIYNVRYALGENTNALFSWKKHKCFEAVISLPSLFQVQWLGDRYFYFVL